MSRYSWTQTPDQVAVSFLLPRTCIGKPVVAIAAHTLVAGTLDETVVTGTLHSKVSPHDSLWQVENTKLGKVVTIHLEKDTLSGMWPVLVSAPLPSGELDATSQFNLATHLEHSDAKKTFELYLQAAERGFVPAMLKLAAFYEIGRENAPLLPVPQDSAKSFFWHKQAADTEVTDWNGEGVAEAAYIVATSYQTGHTVKADVTLALQYFECSIEIVKALLAQQSPTTSPSSPLSSNSRNNFTAMGATTPISMQTGPMKLVNLLSTCLFQAGLLYFEGGSKLPQNYACAREYWEQGAQTSSHPNCLYNLGVLYLNNWGVDDRDIIKALDLMRRAVTLSVDGKLVLPQGLEEAAAAIVKQQMDESIRNRSSVDITSKMTISSTMGGGIIEDSTRLKRSNINTKKSSHRRRAHRSTSSTSNGSRLPVLLFSLTVIGVGVFWYTRIRLRT